MFSGCLNGFIDRTPVTADSAAKFLTEQVIEPCPYLIECVYSNNGSEYKGGTNHAFCVACWENDIN